MRGFLGLAAAAVSVVFIGTAASAMPSASIMTSTPTLAPTLIAEGCGPRFHRGPEGRCIPNGELLPPRRVCPRGTHLGPAGRVCRPNL